jgi:protein-S-isoprenylcysteine O-methyltransferase Ste14
MTKSRIAPLAFAWLGAALFAVSLLWFLYSYLVRFDEVARGGLVRAIVVDVFLFSSFALHHSVMARTGAKRRIEQLVPSGLERSVYTWLASLLFIAVCTWWQPIPGVLYRLNYPWRALAYVIQGTGIALTFRASRALDGLDLAGVRQVQRVVANAAPPQHVPLETTGLYGFVRHPLYFAWTVFVFATPDMTGTRAVFAVISSVYLVVAIPWEERDLIRTFGPAYESYRRQVRWRMVPGLY